MKLTLLVKLIVTIFMVAPLMLSAQTSTDEPVSEDSKYKGLINSQLHELPSALETKEPSLSDVTSRQTDAIWSNTFDNPDDWVESNSSSTPDGIFVITDVFPQALISQGFGPEFNSTVGGNFAFINSDEEGQSASQLANLTTAEPIDFSEHEDLLLEFENYFRRFMETHRVGVSIDGQNWEYITINEVPVNTSSANPEITRVDISDLAGGQPEVWLRFQYQGQWDWFWCIDNVRVTNLPEVSTAVSNPYNPSYSYATPVHHFAGLEIPFGLNVRNFGQAIDSILVTVEVVNTDSESILYSDNLMLDFLPRSADSFVVFEDSFFPELDQLSPGNYAVNYEVDPIGRQDFDPSTNSASFPFVLTETLFALDNPENSIYQNSVLRTDPSWFWGSAYYIAPQEDLEETFFYGSSHAFRVEGGEYTNELALVYLLEFVPDGGPSYNFTEVISPALETTPDFHPAFNQVAIAIIDTEMLSSVEVGELFNIPFSSYLDPENLSPIEDPIALKEDKLYFLVTQIDQDGVEPSLRIAFDPAVSYDGRINNGILFTNDRNFTGFTDAQAPVMRMHIGDIINSNTIITASGLNISTYPNPATEFLNIQFPNEFSGYVELEIYDIQGRKLKNSNHHVMNGAPLIENLSNFNSGQYFVRLITKGGEETVQIMIVR